MRELNRRIERIERHHTTAESWTLVRACPDCGERVEVATPSPCTEHPPITADRVLVLEFRRIEALEGKP